MSAYICDNETISQAAWFLYNGRPTHGTSFDFSSVEELAVALYEMNREAVMQRYPDCDPDDLPGPIDSKFRYVHTDLSIPDGQSVKTLECLRYQCSEGDVPERELFRRLEWAINGAKNQLLARHCPEYANAEWGAYEPPADAPQVFSLSAMAHKSRRRKS